MRNSNSVVQVAAQVAAFLGIGILWVASIIHLTKWLGCVGLFIGFTLFLVGAVTFPFIYWAVEGFEPLWFIFLGLVGGGLLITLATGDKGQ